MTTMLKVSLLDKSIIEALRRSANPFDPEIDQLALRIAHFCYSDPMVRFACEASGIEPRPLQEIYVQMLDAVMPDPVIRHGGQILVPTLVFMDRKRFPDFLRMISNFGLLSADTDLPAIYELAREHSCGLRDAAWAKRGPVSLVEGRSGSGCMLILLPWIVGSGILTVLLAGCSS